MGIKLGSCDSGPRNSDGTWVAGVERGPYKPFPVPVGSVFGELTVLRWERLMQKSRSGGFQPVVRCNCGWEGQVYRHNLLRGRTTRCNGCAKFASAAKRWWKYKNVMPDDQHRCRLLNRLAACISRCSNPKNKSFVHYGGRDIKVADEWRNNRAAFLLYVQQLPGWDEPHLELDRIDTNGNYAPGNVRFVTRSQNASNRRRIADLEAVVADLRYRLLRSEEQVHNLERERAAHRP